jgi:putrescine aminotransferase
MNEQAIPPSWQQLDRSALPASVHATQAARRARHARHHARRGRLPLRLEGAAPRRHVGAVVRGVGYGRKRAGRGAYAADAELPYYNSFFQCATPPAIELARAAGRGDAAAVPARVLHRLGQRANDTVVRLVRRYWQLQGEPRRNIIIGRWNGYHGSTMAGASLGGMKGCTSRAACRSRHRAHRQPYWFERGGGSCRRRNSACAPRARSSARSSELGPRARRGLHRRAGAGRGRRDHPAGDLLARDPAHLRPVRHPAGGDEVICGFGRTGAGSAASTTAPGPT